MLKYTKNGFLLRLLGGISYSDCEYSLNYCERLSPPLLQHRCKAQQSGKHWPYQHISTPTPAQPQLEKNEYWQKKKKNTNGQSEKLHRDFINPFQLVFKKQTWKVVFIAMSHNLATNLCVGGNEATPRHPFALNLSIKEEIKLTWDAK